MKKKKTIPTDKGKIKVNGILNDMINFNLMDHLIPIETTPERQKDWDNMDPEMKKRFENNKNKK